MAIHQIFENDKVTWIDVLKPSSEDLAQLHEQYVIDMLLLQDANETEHMPKYEETETLKFFLTRENLEPDLPHPNTLSEVSTKLGIFITDKFLITIHRTPTKSVAEVLEQLKNAKKKEIFTPSKIALKLAHKVLLTYFEEHDKILDEIDAIENDIFLSKKQQPNLIKDLYRLKRKVGLNFRILRMSNEWVQNFNQLKLGKTEVTNLQETHKNAIENFEYLNSKLTSLVELYLALTDQRNNEAMKILSKYSVYFLPITFIAGVYGMNFDFMPELRMKYAYFITLGGMALIVLVTFIFLNRKKY